MVDRLVSVVDDRPLVDGTAQVGSGADFLGPDVVDVVETASCHRVSPASRRQTVERALDPVLVEAEAPVGAGEPGAADDRSTPRGAAGRRWPGVEHRVGVVERAQHLPARWRRRG